MRIWSLGQADPLKKGMATHSSILAWRTPRRDEVGGLQSLRSQRVRFDWRDLESMHEESGTDTCKPNHIQVKMSGRRLVGNLFKSNLVYWNLNHKFNECTRIPITLSSVCFLKCNFVGQKFGVILLPPS